MIQSVRKAMKILAVLSDAQNRPVPLMEIAAKTGYPKPTCSHLLETLREEGYAVRVSHTEGYLLGPAVYQLTRFGPYEQELIAVCRPVMRWMERKSHATVILSVIRNRQKYIIAYADEEQGLLAEHSAIRTDDLYRTATGRAILARMDSHEVREIWEKAGPPPAGHWDGVTSLSQLTAELKQLRRQEVVRSEDGNNIGFACPLFRGSACVGAIGLAWKGDPPETLVPILKKGAKEINRRLHYE